MAQAGNNNTAQNIARGQGECNLPNTDPKRIVSYGYDKVSYAYRETDYDIENSPYKEWLAELTSRLNKGDRILDLGCGCGVPVACILAERFAVTGVDISPVQIERARELGLNADFVCADMVELELNDASFEAITCFYAIIHVPLEEQLGFIEKMPRWLATGGYLLITVGFSAWTGVEKDWLGVEGGQMYWSHAEISIYRAWFEEAGFSVVSEQFIPEGEGGHSQLLLQKRDP